MKKLVLTLASVFVLSFGFANASSIDSINNNPQNISINTSSTLSSADEAMLFGGKANAMVLDNEEMKNTQGFGFWSSFGDALGASFGGTLAVAGLLLLL
ncbi:hypothetical protein [Helicobacter cappadocius]|uniref:Secreted protein n=1 Tax=Helicobacter cappadocius TaxID=3063998 RepID=A0AA90PSA9_9HELI|nr:MULTISPECIES: hypothetical protein [unclassified Helicobacter]MDO7253338.1 hypothetical protein [Helicobacter sp. faydin-H75]MDP2539232.1 hypothetical protein [Helicobacter sp. faydin-H76]